MELTIPPTKSHILKWEIPIIPVLDKYKDNSMRLFKRYTPGMIAKHVSRLFKGRIYIYGVGKFEFDNGKLVLPESAERRHYQAVKEVNKEIMRLRCAYA